MKSFIKIILAVLVLLLAAVFIVPFFIPQDVYKQQIVSAFERSTGRTLEINGDISIQFRPSLEFVARDVTLSNAPGASDPHMATMDQLTLGLDWQSLLGKEINITKLVLDRPSLALEVLPNGKANWEFETPTTTADAAAQDSASTGEMSAISFGDLRLNDGHLTYRNGLTKETYEVSSVNAKVDLPDLSGPFHVDSSLVYKGEPMDIDLSLGSLAAIPRAEKTPLTLKLSSSLLKADLDGFLTGGKTPLITAKSDVDVPSVRKLAAWNGSPVTMKQGFGPFSAKGDLRLQGSQYKFENAAISFDDMKGTGALTVETGGAKPSVTGNLTVDTVDLRPYAAPAPEGGKKEKLPLKGWSETPIDLSALRSMNANFTVKTKALYIQDYVIGASDLLLRVNKGVLTAALNDLDLYAGKAKGTLTFDASGSTTKINAGFAFTEINAGPLLKAATARDLIEGSGDLAFTFATSGKSQMDFMRGLSGKAGLKLKDGKIIGANLNRMLQIAAALTPQQAAAEGEDQTATQTGTAKTTDFVEMGGSFKLVDGILKTKDLIMINDVLSLTGTGSIDIGKQKVDLRLVPGQNQADGGTRVAMKVQGRWDDIKYVPDFETVLKDKLKDALLGDQKEEDGSGSQTDDVLNLLGTIFGGKDE